MRNLRGWEVKGGDMAAWMVMDATSWFVGEGHGPPAGPCGGVVSRLAAAFAVGRRGGFHIRPGVFAPPQGAAG